MSRSHTDMKAFTTEPLPRNQQPMDPYFGTMLGLMRRALVSGGSEFGLGISLFSLAVSIRAQTILEIGRFKGFSTLALGSALRFLAEAGWDEPQQHKQRPDVDYADFDRPQKRVLISIDPEPTAEAAALIEEAGLEPYVELLDTYSDNVNFDGEADLILIDGDHSYEGCRSDVRRLIPNNLRPGGYFILHDFFGWYDEAGSNRSPIAQVCRELISEGSLQHLLIDTGYQSFVIFRRPDPLAEI